MRVIEGGPVDVRQAKSNRVRIASVLLAVLALSLLAPMSGAQAPKPPAVLYAAQAQCDPTNTLQAPSMSSSCGNYIANGDTNTPPNAILGCSSAASNAFLGAGNTNRIKAGEAGLLAGTSNTVQCNAMRAYIGAGNNNEVTAQDSVTLAGHGNIAKSSGALTGAGVDNLATSLDTAVLVGQDNHVTAQRSFISAGHQNYINMDASYIAAGTNNTIWGNFPNSVTTDRCGPLAKGSDATYNIPTPPSAGGIIIAPTAPGTQSTDVVLPCASFIGAGFQNTIKSGAAAIGAGIKNEIFQGADYAFIGAGEKNEVHGPDSAILAGQKNIVEEQVLDSIIGAGLTNTIGCLRDGTGKAVFCPQRSMIGAGNTNLLTGSDSVILGGVVNTNRGFMAVIGTGTANQIGISGTAAVIGAGNGNLINAAGSAADSMIGAGSGNGIGTYDSYIGAGISNTILFDGSYIGGGRANLVTGQSSYVGAGLNNLNFGAANGMLGGDRNAAGGGAVLLGAGQLNKAGGSGSVIGAGVRNEARAMATTIPAGCQGIADIFGQLTQSACGFTRSDGVNVKVPGTAQRSLFEVRGAITSSGTSVKQQLYTDGATKQLVLRGATTWSFRITCDAIATGGTTTKAWVIDGVVARAGPTIRLVGMPVKTIVGVPDPATLGWDCSPDIDTGSNALTVMAKADTNVRFSASVQTAEVSFGEDLTYT